MMLVNNTHHSNQVNSNVVHKRSTTMHSANDPMLNSLETQLTNLQNQLASLNNVKDMSSKEKLEKIKSLQNQITQLNQQIQQRKVEIQREQQEKAAEEIQENAEKSKPEGKKEDINSIALNKIVGASNKMSAAKKLHQIKLSETGKAKIAKSNIELDNVPNLGDLQVLAESTRNAALVDNKLGYKLKSVNKDINDIEKIQKERIKKKSTNKTDDNEDTDENEKNAVQPSDVKTVNANAALRYKTLEKITRSLKEDIINEKR